MVLVGQRIRHFVDHHVSYTLNKTMLENKFSEKFSTRIGLCDNCIVALTLVLFTSENIALE